MIPTSSAIIDTVTGIGGIPRGRVTEVFGDYSTGKTTLITQMIAELQRRDPKAVVLVVDYEHAFDLVYAHKLGVDLNSDRFIFCQPEDFEQGHEIVDAFAEEGLVDLIVIDSAAAMIPREEMLGDVSEAGRPGRQAQLMSRLLSRVTKKLRRGRKPALVITNQTRTKFDFKNPRLTGLDGAGGNALKFYTSLKLKLEQCERTGEEKRNVNSKQPGTDQQYTRTWIRCTAVKNKLAAPFMRGKFCIDFGTGINNLVSVADMAEEKLGIMSGSGYFKYVGDKPEHSFSVRGREEFHQLLAEKPELLRELEQKVVALLQETEVKGLGLTHVERVKEQEQITIDDNESTAGRLPLD